MAQTGAAFQIILYINKNNILHNKKAFVPHASLPASESLSGYILLCARFYGQLRFLLSEPDA